MKRIIAAILSVVMVLSLLTAQAFAAGKEMKVSVTGVKDLNAIEEGQTITVSVKLPENTSMAGATFTLSYDANYFEVVDATTDFPSFMETSPISKKTGKVTAVFAAMSNKDFSAKANMLTVTLRATGAVGTSNITLTEYNCGAYEGTALKVYGYTAPAATSVTTVAKQIAVSKITVKPSTLKLEVGQTGTLEATVTPDNATSKTVTWTSDKESVATVANDGTVTAVGAGTATITATAANGKKDTCTVTVKVPVCNHGEDKLDHVDGKAATCTENGVKEHYLCECGTTLDLDKKTVLATAVIPATGHKTEKEENKATCANLAVCDVCGERYGSLKKHTVGKVDKVDPTCNTPGVKAHYKCSVCSKWFSDKNGTKEIAEADKASYVIAADPDMHDWKCVEESKENGYTLLQFKCSGCDTVEWDAFVGCDVSVKLVKDEKSKSDLKNADVTVTGNDGSIKMSEDKTVDFENVNIADVIGTGADKDAAIADLKAKLENTTFTVKATAKKSGWKFTTDKTYEVKFVITDNGVQAAVKAEDSDELVPVEELSFTITGKKTTTGGNNGGSGSTTTTDDTTKTDGKKVESGKTFDAGIAMYVGLSVLSVTGGALVIGKKKHF